MLSDSFTMLSDVLKKRTPRTRKGEKVNISLLLVGMTSNFSWSNIWWLIYDCRKRIRDVFSIRINIADTLGVCVDFLFRGITDYIWCIHCDELHQINLFNFIRLDWFLLCDCSTLHVKRMKKNDFTARTSNGIERTKTVSTIPFITIKTPSMTTATAIRQLRLMLMMMMTITVPLSSILQLQFAD